MADSLVAGNPEDPRVGHKDEAVTTHPADVHPDQGEIPPCDPPATGVKPEAKDQGVDGNAKTAPGLRTLDDLIGLMKETRDLVTKDKVQGSNSAKDMLDGRKDLSDYQRAKRWIYAHHVKDDNYTLAEQMHLMYHMSEGFTKLNVPWCCCLRDGEPHE